MEATGILSSLRVDQDAVTFIRGRMNAGARNVDRELRVPLEHVAGVDVEMTHKRQGWLRLEVAGHEPRSNEQDPYTIAFTRKQAEDMHRAAELITQQAAGPAAVAPPAPAAPEPLEGQVVTPAAAGPPRDEDLLPRGYDFWYRLTMWTTGAALALYAIGFLIFVVVVAAFLLAIF